MQWGNEFSFVQFNNNPLESNSKGDIIPHANARAKWRRRTRAHNRTHAASARITIIEYSIVRG